MGGGLEHSSHGGGTRGAPWLLARTRCRAVIDSCGGWCPGGVEGGRGGLIIPLLPLMQGGTEARRRSGQLSRCKNGLFRGLILEGFIIAVFIGKENEVKQNNVKRIQVHEIKRGRECGRVFRCLEVKVVVLMDFSLGACPMSKCKVNKSM